MAYVQAKRMGEKCTPGLMKSVMHFRSKEVGKRTPDAGTDQRARI